MKFLLFFGLSIWCVGCSAQTTGVKLYGYRQAVAQGARPSYETNERGERIEQPSKTALNYFIYLTFPSGVKLYPVEIWINKKAYDLKIDSIPHTPVEMIYSEHPIQTEKMELVPKTNDIVLLLIPIERIPGKNTIAKKTLRDANELVVVYRLRGRFYTAAVKKIKQLPTAVMQ